jgi:hypothetical protein
LGFVFVLFAVMGPAVEPEILEVGGAAAGPVFEVVGFAVGWGAVASGVLAMLVADDERLPQCR